MKTPSLFTIAYLTACVVAVLQQDIDTVVKVAPTSTSCSNAPFADECTTADKATGSIIAAYEGRKLNTAGEQASLLAWMAFESGDFKYVKGHYGDHPPGKGNRCMMSPTFNAEYAHTKGITQTDPATMLQTIIDQGGEWDACAWFYETKCSDAIKQQVQSGTKSGHLAFLQQCVNIGTGTVDSQRLVYWQNAAAAFGLSGQ